MSETLWDYKTECGAVGRVAGNSTVPHRPGCNGACPVVLSDPGPPSMPDSVNHPPHYRGGTYEAIKVIESWGLGFHLGNVLKYISRADLKGEPARDLEKAAWYLAREIERRKVSP